MRPLALLLTVAALVGVFAGGGSAVAARTCTADDLQDVRVPAELNDYGLDSASQQDQPLVAGTTYRVVVVRERAIGSTRNAEPVDSTITVAAPNGPPLTPTTTDTGRPAYDFTPTSGGSVRLVVSWDEEIGSSGDRCSASQAFDIPVLAPTLATVVGKFRPGAHSYPSSFFVGLKGKRPQDPAKVNLILRARKGTTKPPTPRGRALGTFTFTPDGYGGFVAKGGYPRLKHVLDADTSGDGVEIWPYNNIAFGRTLKFAFSIEVTQGGKRLGGMRSGAVCKRKQFRGHSAVKCRAVRLKQQP